MCQNFGWSKGENLKLYTNIVKSFSSSDQINKRALINFISYWILEKIAEMTKIGTFLNI